MRSAVRCANAKCEVRCVPQVRNAECEMRNCGGEEKSERCSCFFLAKMRKMSIFVPKYHLTGIHLSSFIATIRLQNEQMFVFFGKSWQRILDKNKINVIISPSRFGGKEVKSFWKITQKYCYTHIRF